VFYVLIACLCVWFGINGFLDKNGILVIFKTWGILIILRVMVALHLRWAHSFVAGVRPLVLFVPGVDFRR